MNQRGPGRSPKFQDPRLEPRNHCRTMMAVQPHQQNRDQPTGLPSPTINPYAAIAQMMEKLGQEEQRLRTELKDKEALCLEYKVLLRQSNQEVTNLKDIIQNNKQTIEAMNEEKRKLENIIRGKDQELQAKNSELSKANLEGQKCTSQLISVQRNLDDETVRREKLEKQVIKAGIDLEDVRKDLQREKELHKKTKEKNQEQDKLINEQEHRIYYFEGMMTEDFEKKRKVLGDMLAPLKKRKLSGERNE